MPRGVRKNTPASRYKGYQTDVRNKIPFSNEYLVKAREKKLLEKIRREVSSPEYRKMAERQRKLHQKISPPGMVASREEKPFRKRVFKSARELSEYVDSRAVKKSAQPEVPVRDARIVAKRVLKGLNRAASRAGKGMKALGPIQDLMNLPDYYKTYKSLKKRKKNLEEFGRPEGGLL